MSADALAEIEGELQPLARDAADMDRETADARFKEVERMFGDVAGGNEIRGLLSDARREIDARTPNPERALEFIEEAQAPFMDVTKRTFMRKRLRKPLFRGRRPT